MDENACIYEPLMPENDHRAIHRSHEDFCEHQFSSWCAATHLQRLTLFWETFCEMFFQSYPIPAYLLSEYKMDYWKECLIKRSKRYMVSSYHRMENTLSSEITVRAHQLAFETYPYILRKMVFTPPLSRLAVAGLMTYEHKASVEVFYRQREKDDRLNAEIKSGQLARWFTSRYTAVPLPKAEKSTANSDDEGDADNRAY